MQLSAGPTIASVSTIEYKETLIVAGKLSYVDVQSRNFYGAILNNNNDQYSVNYVGPDGTTAGEFTVIAVGLGNGSYRA